MKISVIVPVYNVEKYINDCLDSLIKQDYSDYEIILVDDGGDDRSGEICDEYATSNSRIIVLHQKNAGVSAARNAGLSIATGEYITFVDADDWVDIDYLSLLEKHMCPYGMAACEVLYEKDTAKAKQTLSACSQNELVVRMNKERAELGVLNWNELNGRCWSKIFDRKIIVENNIKFQEDIAYGEDQLFVMQYLFCSAKDTIWIQRAAYHYRTNPQGACNSRFKKQRRFDEKIFSVLEVLERDKKYIEPTGRLHNALIAAEVREKVDVLRIMCLNKWMTHSLYKSCLQDVRKKFLIYIYNHDIGETRRGKVRTTLCCVNPRLLCFVIKVKRGLERIAENGDAVN